MLVDVGDGQGLALHCPHPDQDDVGHQFYQAADVKCAKAVHCMGQFDVCNLHEENGDVNFCQWFCNAVNFVSPVELQNVSVCISNFVCT